MMNIKKTRSLASFICVLILSVIIVNPIDDRPVGLELSEHSAQHTFFMRK